MTVRASVACVGVEIRRPFLNTETSPSFFVSYRLRDSHKVFRDP